MVVFRQSSCIRAKVVVIGQSGSIREKLVILLQSGCNQGKWFYSGKVVVFMQK